MSEKKKKKMLWFVLLTLVQYVLFVLALGVFSERAFTAELQRPGTYGLALVLTCFGAVSTWAGQRQADKDNVELKKAMEEAKRKRAEAGQ
ncbi:hypothetical protein [Bifidobacterium sp. ESL0704]|uniref:hypothetical protein n=1 Tax=Bifidobacterium sp. ESL0704 TaxID=2983219 RepID=UPI0023FA2DA3|nr:hypothetical protein [Bifidobacterium sp. ESL0704]WEV52351.1 hypothetical protein OZX64_05450 [Bifidobacterium sp. ESL0704]